MTSLPKSTLLSLLARAIETKVITRSDVDALFPKTKRRRKPGPCRVDPEIRAKAAELSQKFGLTADGLRLRVHKLPNGSQYMLYIYRGSSFAVRGISEQFTDIREMHGAADKLVTAYLRYLDNQT